jgi:hypothetical protein
MANVPLEKATPTRPNTLVNADCTSPRNRISIVTPEMKSTTTVWTIRLASPVRRCLVLNRI